MKNYSILLTHELAVEGEAHASFWTSVLAEMVSLYQRLEENGIIVTGIAGIFLALGRNG
jgi:hypothetical protein